MTVFNIDYDEDELTIEYIEELLYPALVEIMERDEKLRNIISLATYDVHKQAEELADVFTKA